ncbi:MAG: STAS domain-containing protein [Gemmatimonadetes bacterium]|nr:STAS domain-containing protein [Gemmatimonadota bacterium]
MFDILIEENTARFSGRLDASQVEKAREVLDGVNRSVEFDFADLDYISSAGIGVIVITFKRLSDAGNSLKLKNLNPNIRNVFRYAGLDKVIVIE